MAGIALRTQPVFMHILVAVSALRTHLLKTGDIMTAQAGGFFMGARQTKTGGVVVKTYRMPTGLPMTGLAIEFRIGMGIGLGMSPAGENKQEQNNQIPHLISLSVGVTGITVDTAIHIAAYFLVFIIHFCLIVFMTIDAFKTGKIVFINMTITTGIPLSPVLTGINRKIFAVMIKSGAVPAAGGMAAFTGGWKTGGNMIGVRHIIIVRLMAGNTFRGRITVSVAVAGRTLLLLMSACQGEIRIGVIKGGRFPGTGAVAGGAVMAEIIRLMIGIADSVEIRTMTTPAITGGVFIAVAMAIHTINGGMGTG